MRRSPAAGLRLATQRVFERELPIEPCLEVCAVHAHLQLVPRGAIQHELFAAELDVAADAVVELPESDVVLRIVVADREPIAVGLHVEENARAAVAIAGD